jgi:hypothetical protein
MIAGRHTCIKRVYVLAYMHASISLQVFSLGSMYSSSSTTVVLDHVTITGGYGCNGGATGQSGNIALTCYSCNFSSNW